MATTVGAEDSRAQGTEVLDTRHIVYLRQELQWLRNENRLRGGDAVLDELVPFDWERTKALVGGLGNEQTVQVQVETDLLLTTPLYKQSHYRQRQAQAVYLNFPDMYATVMAGHLLRAAPKPDAGLSFGNLGVVRPSGTKGLPTQAEMLYYNADGVGNQSSQWDNFWIGAMRRAMATGHRWIMVEAPKVKPQSREDEAKGYRPYLVEYSPTQVTNWHYEDGQLKFAVLRVTAQTPYLDLVGAGSVDSRDDYLLLVANGYGALGDQFAAGGWWRFDYEKNLIGTGAWDKTGGQVPLFPLFYERDRGSRGDPRFSRSATSELGQCAVSYMNLASAADFDAWDAAMSIEWLAGVDVESFNLAMAKMKEGSRFIPLQVNGETQQMPTVKDSQAGAIVAEVFDKRLSSKREEANQLASREAAASPDSSGMSKKAGFGTTYSPRLALVASELEQAQNTALMFLEQRFGYTDNQASVNWTRDFELLEVVQHIEAMFALEKLSGLHSPTLDSQMMTTAARQKGLLSDASNTSAVQQEYEDAAGMQLAARQTSLKNAAANGSGQQPAGTSGAPSGGGGGAKALGETEPNAAELALLDDD